VSVSKELEQTIVSDLREERLDFGEIAALRFGDENLFYKVSYIANKPKYRLSRKDRRGKHNKSRNSKVESEPPKKTITEGPIKISIFEQKSRLDLIDAAITTHKALLAQITDTYKMDRWSAALERLFEQRRIEESSQNNNYVAAIDLFIEELKRETAEDEPKAAK